MASSKHEDSFAPFDDLLRTRLAANEPLWINGTFAADLDLFRELLSIPIAQGDRQESGRPAKAFDAWIAHGLRRAGFPDDAVWPRLKRPRVLIEGLSKLETSISQLGAALGRVSQVIAGDRVSLAG
jgi:hypothetical protein